MFTPVTVGGGVRSVEDALSLLRAGADKVAINTAAIKRPELITELAEKIGSQSVVLQIDAKRKSNGWEAWCEGGRVPTGKDAIQWAREATGRGAGEVLITSIDCEGTARGIDEDALRAAQGAVSVPAVYSGGIASAAHIADAAAAGASGVACAGLLHFNLEPLESVRDTLSRSGIRVRPVKQAA